MTASISINGTSLDNLLAQGVEGSQGLHTVPAKRGSNVEVPGRHGAKHIPGKRYQPAALVLPMWVRGVNPDGSVPSDASARLTFHQRVRELVALFTVGELVTVRHTLTDGTAREITGEVTDLIDFTIEGVGRSTLGRVSVGLTCADPFWTDLAATTATFALATGATRTLTEFAAATAPMEDLIVSFGPGTNIELSQPAVSSLLAYDGPITAGRKLAVDTAEWTATGTVDAGGTWLPATAPTQHIRRIRHGRHPRLWYLAPTRPAAPVVRLVHTGGGTVSVTISGKQRHLVP